MESEQNKEFELPPVAPDTESTETGQSHEETTEAIRLERGQTVQQTPLTGAVTVQQIPQGSALVAGSVLANTNPSPSFANDLPLIADDLDLIEKEWVEKAKHVVRVTLGDPYSQNKELSKIKADYIKKRYNKDIKTID